MSPQPTIISESRTRKALRRATNLLTTNGFLNPDFDRVIMERDDTDTTLPSLFRNNSIGASIKRRLQEAKSHPIVRSISRRRHSESESNSRPSLLLFHDNHKGTHHFRAFSSSEFATARSTIVPHVYGAPESINVPEQDETDEGKDPISPPPSTNSLPPSPVRSKSKQISMADVPVPTILHRGVPMTKVSAKRQKTFVFRLDPDQGHILYESNKTKISAL